MTGYNIRNTDITLSNYLIQQAKNLSSNQSVQQGRSITDTEIDTLLDSALKNDGTISEEEIKFIAGLTVESNVNALKQKNFSPVNRELHFSNVSDTKISDIRNKAYSIALRSGAMSPVEKEIKKDPRLVRFFNALNDPSLSPEQRRQLVQEYKVLSGQNYNHLKTIADEDFFSSGIHYKVGTSFNDRAGVFKYFIDNAQKAPFKQVMAEVVKTFNSRTFSSPQEAFNAVYGIAVRLKVDDPKRYALMSMAAMSTDIHNGSFPKEYDQFVGDLRSAYIKFNNYDENSGGQVVMSHGVVSKKNDGRIDFSEDNGFHFWSHAFISYELMSRGQNGQKYDEQEVRNFSAYVGAEYELSSPWENLGNAAIKDVLMNAYGAEYGILMFKNKGVVPLPKKFEGPQSEDRTHKSETGKTS